MAVRKQKKINPAKLSSYILWGCAGVALIVLNSWYLDKYLSSNSGYITAYQAKQDSLAQYRNPAVAGLFYASEAEKLSKNVTGYLTSGNFRPLGNYQPKILIVPHAGYIYSASTAGKAYAALQKKASGIKNILLVGPAHFYRGKGAFLADVDYFSTPLGDVSVNKKMARAIAAENKAFHLNNKAHLKEHSLEVQLPFIQKVLPKAKIIPLVYGDIAPEVLAAGLQKYLAREDTILIISADLSHYYSYDEARKIDEETARKIADNQSVEDHESCGAAGINAALLLAGENFYRPQMLELVNSGDTGGDKSRVVGYGAWSFYPDSPKPAVGKLEQEVENLQNFANLYGSHLREIAKISLEKAVKYKKRYSPSRASFPEVIFDKGATFVTLHKNGELRGCIGSILPSMSVAQNVSDNAYAAAMEDSRFSPVKEDELSELTYSIALLSGFEKIEYADEQDVLKKIRQGRDGIVIRDGNRQGVFLPSVWKEIADKTEFFKKLKIKAGMNPNYWNNRINVYRFRTVEITDEN